MISSPPPSRIPPSLYSPYLNPKLVIVAHRAKRRLAGTCGRVLDMDMTADLSGSPECLAKITGEKGMAAKRLSSSE